MRSNKGITMLTMIMAVMILLVLAAVSINTILTNNAAIKSAEEAGFKSEVLELKNRLDKRMSDVLLRSGDTSMIDNFNELKRIFGDGFNDELLKKVAIIGGELAYIPKMCTEDEIKWFIELGIKSALAIDVIVKERINSEGLSIATNTTGGYDLVFVLDLSASMTAARIKTLADCVNSTIYSVLENEYNRIAVVVFSTNAASEKILDLGHYNQTANALSYSGTTITLNKNNLGVPGGGTKSYSTGSGTYTQKGILLAYNELTGPGSALQVDSTDTEHMNYNYRNNVPAIMIITDGAPNIHTANVVPGAGGSAGGADGTLDGGYWTVLTASHYKTLLKEAYIAKSKPGPMFFTIGTDLDTNNDVGRFAALTLKPSEGNMSMANQLAPCAKCVEGYTACTKCNVKGSNNIPGNGVCGTCKGTGTTGSGSSTAGCTACNTKGSGTKNSNIKPGDGVCGTCKGNGYTTTKCTTCKGAGTASSTLAKPLYDKLNTDKTSGWYDFSDYSAVGLFDAAQLQENINTAISQIAAGVYENDIESTGMYTSSTQIEITNEDDTTSMIDFAIDQNKPISLTVTVGLVEYHVDSLGNPILDSLKKPLYTLTKTETKTKSGITYSQIASGQIPNLKISNGRMLWYLRSEYENTRTGMVYELQNSILESIGKTEAQLMREDPPKGVEVTEVIIEYWVKSKE